MLRKKTQIRRGVRRRFSVILIVSAVCLLAFSLPAIRFFRTLTGAMAVSNASDLITRSVSNIVEEKMDGLNSADFISFEKDGAGGIAAIVTNTAQVNRFSSELLAEVIRASNAGNLDIAVPLGDLLGMSLFLGKGPRIPMHITLLTSSRVNFRNVLTAAGINQSRHQLLLEIRVDADVLLPWEIRSTQVVNEVLVAETIIIGHVPNTYLSIGE